ncbi:extracellular solute-binding protein, family 5 [Shewanella denitrificans OS217]|uniref:Extracellular solute-binding protein, family 5 n=1 Tax=Shewanella denitrificans (strain OS217 / ATCC BAA-1090 / DSM 15013) TaxID=318161 RepID=Q12LB4_SHEDO|nr:ABC transporter substrate-binding protein [Shewanella denitrificans]ABE55762.1 extracellular solute-binding protein, family 5 [Shewanella denitrificans OS217]
MMRQWQLTLVCACSLLLSACGKAQLPSGLVYCSEGNPETFNPQLITSGTTVDATSNQIYNRLVDYDVTSASIVPSLATQWQVSEDGLTYRFHLRRDVHFHQSELFTPSRYFNADDVLFSFNRIIDLAHPYHYLTRTGYPFFQSISFAELVDSIEKVNDFEVVFHLTRPDATFISNLATDFAVILSAEYGQQLLAQNQAEKLDFFAIGTGPFRLDEYVKNEYIRYKKHPDFWGEPPKIEMLVFDITPRSSVRLAKLITGDCSVSALPKATELAVVKQHPNLVIDTQAGLNVAFWAFNTQKAPFNDVRVRQALAHAVDKDNILRVVYHDTAVAATGVLPPASWAYTPSVIPNEYNPGKARALLKEAGVSRLQIDIWAMPVARVYNPNALKTAELIQADLAAIGVKVNIISFDWSVFTQKLALADYDSVLIGWNADNSDPDNFFSPLLSCAAFNSNNNRSRWCLPAFDELLAKAQATTDKGERKALYQAAEAIIAAQVPMVNLAHGPKVVLRKSSLISTHNAPYGGISFAAMMLAPPQLTAPIEPAQHIDLEYSPIKSAPMKSPAIENPPKERSAIEQAQTKEQG